MRTRLRAPLDRLFQNTFAVAKRVRSDTRIGANPVSVAFTAVRLAERVFADLGQACVLLIGAGETIELAARHLTEARVRRLIVANRTLENAQALAGRFGGYAITLADLPKHLAEADIVISSTASREPVLDRDTVAAAIAQRRRKPMFLVDIAVPRDIDPAVASIEDVFLYTIDDLREVIDENLRGRREAARDAEAMIELSVEHFMGWWRALDLHNPVSDLRRHAEANRDEVLAKAQALLARGRPADEVLAFLANTLTNKLLHAPSANLRAAALRGDAESAARRRAPVRERARAAGRARVVALPHPVVPAKAGTHLLPVPELDSDFRRNDEEAVRNADNPPHATQHPPQTRPARRAPSGARAHARERRGARRSRSACATFRASTRISDR